MLNNKIKIGAVAALSFVLLSGFGLNDLKKELGPDTDKCDKSSNKSKCKNEEYLKSAAKVAAISVAAKLMYDMVIDYRTEQVQNDKEISAEYIDKFGKLPKKSDLFEYGTTLDPVNIMEAGTDVDIQSKVKVVVGTKEKKVKVEERLDVYDNEDPNKVINTLTKTVHEGKGGEYRNYFKFNLPKGLPQGIYKMKTTVFMDGKEANNVNSEMQIVLDVLPNGNYRVASLAQ